MLKQKHCITWKSAASLDRLLLVGRLERGEGSSYNTTTEENMILAAMGDLGSRPASCGLLSNSPPRGDLANVPLPISQ